MRHIYRFGDSSTLYDDDERPWTQAVTGFKPSDCSMNDRLEIDEREPKFNPLLRTYWLLQSIVISITRFLRKCMAGGDPPSRTAAVAEYRGAS